MFLANKLCGAGNAEKTYSDDVFALYNYAGGTPNQSVINDIDLAGKGGLVIIKPRTTNTGFTNDTIVMDTARGLIAMSANKVDGQIGFSSAFASFNDDGFTLGGAGSALNVSGVQYISATFREAPNFLDVVTYTGNGATNNVSHNLKQIPKLIISKCLSTNSGYGWSVTYIDPTLPTSAERTKTWSLENTAFSGDTGNYRLSNFNDTTFNAQVLGNHFSNAGAANTNGLSYVSYLFADDTSSEGLIRTTLFTTDASGNATVPLGWEPQFALIKAAGVSDWTMLDILRGWSLAASSDRALSTNATSVESVATDYGYPRPDGFEFKGAASTTYLVLAVRRPNKPPTYGTAVFSPERFLYSNTFSGMNKNSGSNNPQDLFIMAGNRTAPTSPAWLWLDRVRGFSASGSPLLNSASNAAEETRTSTPRAYYSSDRVFFQPFDNSMVLRLARKAGVFDITHWKGDGAGTRSVPHNMLAKPKLMIGKYLSGGSPTVTDWMVASEALDVSVNGSDSGLRVLKLNTTAANFSNNSYFGAAATETHITVGANLNYPNAHFVGYLFGDLLGISKVGVYTGNGTSQNIDCGFTTGARLLLIRSLDTGDWYLWDSGRGIIAAEDPHLSLNTSVAEVTSDDSVDPYSGGFTVNQVAATNINVNSTKYLFLAIA